MSAELETTERTLAALDFPAIVDRLAARTATPMGEERVRALRPAAGRLAVRRAQAETTEARLLLDAGQPLPFEGARDIRAAVARAEKSGRLEAAELWAVASTARAAARLARHLRARREAAPALADRAETLGDHTALAAAIEAAVDADAALRDDASPDLARLRRQHRTLSARLRERLDSLARSPALAPFLQEPLVTLRGGRYVVPVKAEHRAQVPGVVHDTSSSGATVFIEPMAVVEVNNELRRLEALIREEEERILDELGARVRAEAAALRSTVEALGDFDLIAARARLSAEMDAVEPEGLDGDLVELRGARHPLLTGPVVPIDVRLGGEIRTLVITGPNTGGKTVSLKTVGLFALMAQCGLHVPARPGSRLPVFPQVFCDAGDEQGVAQSLSTFSSHMSHIVEMVRRARPGALVLLDELGAGTDPQEGAALAMAILQAFQERGCLTMATTHYSELKAFAHREPGMRNASVEFDADTLRPTYRLVIGLPGKSHAFAIAARLGLPEEILERARAHLSAESREVADLLEELAALRDELRRERDAAERARREADEQAAAARRRLEALERERDSLAREAREKAQALVRRARAEAEALVAEARRRLEEESAAEAAARAEAALAELRRRERALAEAPAAASAGDGRAAAGRVPEPGELVPGRTVYVRSLRLEGEVLAPPDAEDQVAVRVGVMRVHVPRSDLAVAPTDGAAAGSGGGGARGAGGRRPPAGHGGGGTHVQLAGAKAREIRPELDLHGLTVDEALPLVDKYLDDAYLAGLRTVRLVHGKGTGALRQAVRRFLATHRLVDSFRPGAADEGGPGTTVARLRD
ncbi:MAG: endonuclease MutS2 [Firmicutes bacterium]|nr:endonuclease MutS2 [Bacillota bacterium]